MPISKGDSFSTSNQGLTLIELLISVALFGLLSLGIATLFAEHAKKTARSQNETRLGESILEFSDALEGYLGNLTHIETCYCNTGCMFDPVTTKNCTDDQPNCRYNNLLEFDTEAATDPSVETTGTNCLDGTYTPSSANPGTTRILRGCKERLYISYAPPVAGSGAPGRLSIIKRIGAQARVLHTLNGVYEVRCGQPRYVDTTGTPQRASNHFHFEFRAKARASNVAAPNPSPSPSGSPNLVFEGWHPSDPRFFEGIHRQFSTDIAFRNWNVRGIHFGRPFGFNQCIADGEPQANGVCCSGFQNVTTCIPAANCVPRGTVPTSGADTECCSHLLNSNTGLCL